MGSDGIGAVLGGAFAAIIGILVTLTLFFSLGIPTEKMMTIFQAGDVFNIGSEWAAYDGTATMISIMYVAIMSPALSGLGILFLVILKRQRRDVETVETYQPTGV